MKKKTPKSIPRSIPRNGSALAARMRNSGGYMKHRLEPKKGAKNDQPELLEEADLIVGCEHNPKQYCEACIKSLRLSDPCEDCTCDDPDPGISRGCPIHDIQEDI
jgi:hypothetical protein